jgi:hypothetical protein
MSLWDVMLSTFWFMILFAWIWLLIAILSDIFRDHDLSGWGKARWTLSLIVVPWLGALTYLIVRGRPMNDRAPVQAGQVGTTLEELRVFADSLAGTDEVALEATGNSYAIATLLAGRVGRVAVSNPKKTRAIAEAKVKTDKVDAAILAQLLAAGHPAKTTSSLHKIADRPNVSVRVVVQTDSNGRG